MSSFSVLRNMRAVGDAHYKHAFPCGRVVITASRAAQLKRGNIS